MEQSGYNEFQIDKSHDKVSRIKPAFSERGQWKPLAQEKRRAALEQPARSGTAHPRYRMT